MLCTHRLMFAIRKLLAFGIAFVVIAPFFLAATVGAEAQTPTPLSSKLYLEIGRSYEEGSQPTKAADFYLKALEADPTNGAALDALRSVLKQQQSGDQRLAIADQYMAAREYDKAVDLYLKILADRPGLTTAQQQAQTAIDRSDDLATQTITEAIGVSKVIVTGLPILVFLLLLWGVARLVKWIRQHRLRSAVEYIILLFDNATGVEALSGVEEGARAALIEWLQTNHAVVKDKIPEAPIPVTLPDLGSVMKIFNWFVTQITPTPQRKTVNGILLGPRTVNGNTEAGLSVRVSDAGSGRIERTHTIWSSTTSPGDQYVYLELACGAASWIYKPEDPMQPASAYQLGPANATWARAAETKDPAKKKALAAHAVQLARDAEDTERRLATVAAAGGLAGAATKAVATPVASTIAADRLAMFQEYLESLP